MATTRTGRARPLPVSVALPGLVPPRFGTPRDLGRATYGHELAEVARRLRKPLMPWQQYVADVALEVDPATGELFYEEVVITVPRQSGKTTLILALMAWRCVIVARRLGPQTVTYLAQSGKMARRKLEREFVPILKRGIGFRMVPHSRARPQRPTDFKPSMNNGNEHILFGTDSYLQVEAPTETGSHGDVLDMPVIDEAFAHGDDLVEQAVDAASVTRRSPQSFVISTAGNERSVFLWRKVLAGRRQVRERLPGRSCYFEWSVPEDARWDDPAVWAEYLPALGHTITEARLMARLAKALANPDEGDDDEGYEPGVAGFRRGYLNQWMKTPLLGGEVGRPREIEPDRWEALTVKGSGIVGRCVIGVGVTRDGVSSSLVVAGWSPSAGMVHVETLDRQAGTFWVESRLAELVQRWAPVAVAWDASGPARVLDHAIGRACGLGPKLVRLSSTDWTAACGAFRTAVMSDPPRVQHLGDLWILEAVRGAERRDTIAGFVWDLKASETDIGPLLAATAAYRALDAEDREPVDPLSQIF